MRTSPGAYPMTAEQEAIWLDDHLRDGDSRYVESWVHRFDGDLDRGAVRWALERIVARHEALRSRFVLEDDRLVQRVLPWEPGLELETVSCAATSLAAGLEELVRRPLDVADSPMRATLVEVAPRTAVLVVQLHHLVIDDWALQILEREFEEHYRAHVERRPAAVAPVELQPGAHALARQATPKDPAVRAYWRENLRGLSPDAAGTLAASDTAAPASGTGEDPDRGDTVAFAVDAETAGRVRAVCRRLRATPFAVFASLVSVLLHAAGGARDVIVGTPVSHRDSAGHDLMMAPMSALLPLCVTVNADASFAELVGRVRTRGLEALTYKDISYGELVGMTRRRGRADGRGMVRTVLVVDDAEPSRLRLPGVEAQRLYVHSGVSKFDLCLTLVAQERGYLGFLEYAVGLFPAGVAERIAEDFVALLDRVCDNPDGTVARLLDQSPSPCVRRIR
ncbi:MULTISPECIES: condensation domain-containing protein [unclassified Streptomyces]|uniref:condensation domain-containing protein n=1 Tax=unclassified Streptomyces TaxID=2593676 RepID=UPI000932D434|nr:condensation domain-containing protein [Streptomyces sp. NBRC 110465]